MAFENWQESFETELDKAEKKELIPVLRYFRREYLRGVQEYFDTGKVSNWDGYFNPRDIGVLYAGIYTGVGLRFSKLYAGTVGAVYQPLINPSDYTPLWRDNFRNAGLKIAEFKGVSVARTQQKELTRVISRLHRSPEFQAMNERSAQRILRSQVKGLTEWRAKTIVRTEATNAANYATMKTAQDMYGEDNLTKTWNTSFANSRDTHIRAHNQKKDFKEKFVVGGEYLMHPGSGSLPENNINCKCSSLPLPK